MSTRDFLLREGNSFFSSGNYNKALEYYNEILQNDPEDVDVLNNKTNALSCLGKHEEAIECCDKVIEIDSKNVNALNNKGSALAKLGKHKVIEAGKSKPVKAEKLYIIQEESLANLSEDYVRDFLQNVVVRINDKIQIPHNGRMIEIKISSTYPTDTVLVVPSTVIQITARQEIEYLSNLRPKQTEIISNEMILDKSELTLPSETCATPDCKEKLHGLNSKHCKLCGQRVCIDHLQLHINKYCPKTMFVPYIKKDWIMKRGQNVSSGIYNIICQTCSYVSDFPQLIEYAGKELVSHLDNNPECKEKKRTFLVEFDIESMRQGVKIESSIVRDPDRTLWVCSHCRPPRKFTNHDEYIAHHYTHN